MWTLTAAKYQCVITLNLGSIFIFLAFSQVKTEALLVYHLNLACWRVHVWWLSLNAKWRLKVWPASHEIAASLDQFNASKLWEFVSFTDVHVQSDYKAWSDSPNSRLHTIIILVASSDLCSYQLHFVVNLSSTFIYLPSNCGDLLLQSVEHLHSPQNTLSYYLQNYSWALIKDEEKKKKKKKNHKQQFAGEKKPNRARLRGRESTLGSIFQFHIWPWYFRVN